MSITAVFLLGCGVRLSDPPPERDVLHSLDPQGDLVAGSPLLLTIEVIRSYPLPVQVFCFTEELPGEGDHDSERAIPERIAAFLVDPVPSAVPGQSDLKQTLQVEFMLEAPGQYSLACLTPSAPEHAIALTLEVQAP